jgi:dihydroorotase-like cyclic amidohydrolase
MNPPLRSARDREAILEGIVDGTIEILCSDHAPHCDFEKEVEFDYAPFGITGLEVEFALALMQLYHAKRLSSSDLIAKYTVAPSQIAEPRQRHAVCRRRRRHHRVRSRPQLGLGTQRYRQQIAEQSLLRLAA